MNRSSTITVAGILYFTLIIVILMFFTVFSTKSDLTQKEKELQEKEAFEAFDALPYDQEEFEFRLEQGKKNFLFSKNDYVTFIENGKVKSLKINDLVFEENTINILYENSSSLKLVKYSKYSTPKNIFIFGLSDVYYKIEIK